MCQLRMDAGRITAVICVEVSGTGARGQRTGTGEGERTGASLFPGYPVGEHTRSLGLHPLRGIKAVTCTPEYLIWGESQVCSSTMHV